MTIKLYLSEILCSFMDKQENSKETPKNAKVNPPHSDVPPLHPKEENNDREDVSNATNGTPEKEGRESTRSKMALLFVLGFFAILFLCFLYAIMVGASLPELKDALSGVIGGLSGILGFIVGYYYKASQDQ